MINIIWFFMIAIGIIYGAFAGNLGEVNNIILKEAGEGVTFAISLMGIMCFWMGIMNIARSIYLHMNM